MEDGYLGSGLRLRYAKDKYGEENFELTPLKFFSTRTELVRYEKAILTKRFLNYYHDICYNVSEGGEGGNMIAGKCEDELNDLRRKLSECVRGEKNPMYGKHISEETRKKLSLSMKGKGRSEETKEKISKSNKGKKRSDEFRNLMSKAKKGRHWRVNPDTGRREWY
jgi:hypothetical protein